MLKACQPPSKSGCEISKPVSNVYGSMSYSPSSSSNSPSSSAVASWYCWYSDTRSFIFDSASVNYLAVPLREFLEGNPVCRSPAVRILGGFEDTRRDPERGRVGLRRAPGHALRRVVARER